MTRRETIVYLALLAVVVWLTARYVTWWFDGAHVPTNDSGHGWRSTLFNLGPFLALTVLEAVVSFHTNHDSSDHNIDWRLPPDDQDALREALKASHRFELEPPPVEATGPTRPGGQLSGTDRS